MNSGALTVTVCTLVRRWATYMTNIHNFIWLRRPSSASKVLPLSLLLMTVDDR